MASIPNVSCGYFNAPGFFSISSCLVTSGNDENAMIVAHNKNMLKRIIDGVFTDEISATGVYELLNCPNNARLNNTGPIVVPNEFTPPVRLSLCEPVDGLPKAITNGLATICCNVKPSPMINIHVRSMGYDCIFVAGIKPIAPTAEMSSPSINPFLYPRRKSGSLYKSVEKK